MKKHFKKKILMAKEDKRRFFFNSTKCWFCDINYTDNDVKVRDHCQMTGNCKGSAHRDCNMNV